MRRAASLAATVLALGLSACAWTRPKADPTEFFVLESRAPATAPRPGRPRLALEVELPDYLKNPRIATRLGQDEISYAEFDRWAEPLAEGLARVIHDDLSDAADVEREGAEGGAPRYRLSVRVSSFEAARSRSGALGIRFAATWELAPVAKGAAPVGGAFNAPAGAWDGKDYAALTRQLSEAVAALCADIRRAIERRRSP